MMNAVTRTACFCLAAVLAASAAVAAEPAPERTARDPIREDYKGYVPTFVTRIAADSGYQGAAVPFVVPPESMRLSSEKGFYTLSQTEESDRANALVLAAIEREKADRFRDALDIYQKVLDEYGDSLYRVSDYGVFVPVGQYCQRRMLILPKEALAFYRTKFDPRAKESYDQALRKHWLIGFSDILGNQMATAYGDRSLFELGRSALDNGHYLQGLEYLETIRDYFPNSTLHGEGLSLSIRLCHRMLGTPEPGTDAGAGSGKDDAAFIAAMKQVVENASHTPVVQVVQRASAPNSSADDYASFPPTTDPLALKPPVWREQLPASQGDYIVFSQPVVTDRSVIYRHKNIVYCRSILNGELRWMNDLGGRVKWQSPPERQYPLEDLLVKDGIVFTPKYKVGPSLVALDEVSGQVRWAYGPIVAGTEEEAHMRFESAPAAGPECVYAGYILDNIIGETHTDTEYGVMAFESTTGRILWRTRLCRLAPGLFAAGFAEYRRNKIRSFSSPPLYYEGTVYYCTNAGVIVALDASSGRIKWLMRYPYYPSVHDASRVFGEAWYRCNYWRPHGPMFWFNQRPLMLGDRLVVLPVDTKFTLCLERKTGKVEWTRYHPGDYTFVVGPTKQGYLAQVSSGTAMRGTVSLIDPADKGNTVWSAPPVIFHDDQPVAAHPAYGDYGVSGGMDFNRHGFYVGAWPFLTTDDRLYVSTWIEVGYWGWPPPWAFTLAEVSLPERKILSRRRYYTGDALGRAARKIETAPGFIKRLEEMPVKTEGMLRDLKRLKEVAADHVPVNKYGPFLPFSRITFERFGVPFELRFGPQEIGMLYDVGELDKVLAGRTDPDAEFARAEVGVNRGQYEQAVDRLNRCLQIVSSEDLDFRTQVNQQLYSLNRRLVRTSTQGGMLDKQLFYATGMSRSVTRLPDEIETLLVLSDVNERRGEPDVAARELQSVVDTYGPYEYPVPALAAADSGPILNTGRAVIERMAGTASGTVHFSELTRTLELEKKSISVYLGTLSPLERALTARAGDLAVAAILRLQQSDKTFAARFEAAAAKALQGKDPAEQAHWIRMYPGTKTVQRTLEDLLKEATARERNEASGQQARADARTSLWNLADLARVCGLDLPEPYRLRLLAPADRPTPAPLAANMTDKKTKFDDERGMLWLIAQRWDSGQAEPDLMFLAGRVKKRMDNKFVLYGFDLRTGKQVWTAREPRGTDWFDEIRLEGKGDEAGFFSVYVYGDLAVTHGLFDVLAFGIKDGKLRWRYRVPQGFDTRHALFSGDIMTLHGKAETVALYIPTADPRGEVIWQEKEEGDIYAPAYFVGDRLVCVRKMPFNITVRYRGTGKLMGRLALPDLLLHEEHPLIENGPQALPIAQDGPLVTITDGYYYVMINVEQMNVVWKRLIDANDPTRLPPIRLELGGEYLAVLKQDFDQKAIYILSSRTGEVLWKTDPKVPGSPQPMYSMFIQDGKLYGIGPHPGQGFYFVGIDCRTGAHLFRQSEQAGYSARPDVRLRRELCGNALIVEVRDRQDFELKALDAQTGKLIHTLKVKAAGDFGQHGCASATVQNGHLVLLGVNDLVTTASRGGASDKRR